MKLGAIMLAFVACAPLAPAGHVEPCITKAPPIVPKVTWLPPGCPPQYGACLTGEDAGLVAAYMEGSRKWMADVNRRCRDR